jgi:hypothetical protein
MRIRLLHALLPAACFALTIFAAAAPVAGALARRPASPARTQDAQATEPPPQAGQAPQAAPPQVEQTPDSQSAQATGLAPAQPPPSQSTSDAPQLKDIQRSQGPFRIGGADYTVVLHDKQLAAAPAKSQGAAPKGTAAKATATLEALEILDAAGNIVYQDSFPYGVTEGQFTQRVMASAQLMAGDGGQAIVIHYTKESPSGRSPESWQVFGLVNGKLASFGAPLPLGQGEGIAAGGVVTGVMVKNGISVVPLASTADKLEFRVWEGHFSIDVVVRVDWVRGQWSQGEECYELGEGDLKPKGCNLRVVATPRARGSDSGYVQLFAATDGDEHNAQQVEVRSDSAVEFVETRAVVNWMADGDRIACSFDDVWLHVRIDGKDGWVHGDADFAALGLPAANAPQ